MSMLPVSLTTLPFPMMYSVWAAFKKLIFNSMVSEEASSWLRHEIPARPPEISAR